MTDSQKIDLLGKLANYYYTFRLNSKGDSILHEQLILAEISNKPNLILQTLFSDALQKLSPNASNESFASTINFINKGLKYAQSVDQYDYLTLGYIRLSELYRRRGDLEQAQSSCFKGLMQVNNVTDSIKALLYIELGNVYLKQNEALLACTNFNNAYKIALHGRHIPLQSKIYHSLSEMYKSLGDTESAKKELLKSLALNKQAGNRVGLMDDYYDLARISDEDLYIHKTINLADSMSSLYHLLNAKRLMLAYLYVVKKDAPAAIKFLSDEYDLKQTYFNDGPGNYQMTLGNIYYYSNHIDSALVFYQMALTTIKDLNNQNITGILYSQIGNCYNKLKNESVAVTYYEKAYKINLERGDINALAKLSKQLSTIYFNNGAYKLAYEYLNKTAGFKDTLRELSRQNEIALLGVDRENMKHHQELMIEKQHELNQRNIQYAGIFILILIAFFFMMVIGSFSIPPYAIRMMGYFFFISLFEFIVLLIDNFLLHTNFGHQPMIIWGIKILLIALLVPFQHFLEHNMIKILSSNKLMNFRKTLSIKSWITSKKRSTEQRPEKQEEEEEEIGVL